MESNANIYIKILNIGFVILIVYVDDCILINNTLTLTKFILQQEFDMLDDGEIHYTLGNAILHNHKKGWTILHQEWYPISKLRKIHMFNCNSLKTPKQSRTWLNKHDSPNTPTMQVIMDIYPHSNIVGNLMHS